MEIITSYYTDVGKMKHINQDSLLIKVVNSSKGMIAFAVICDGMGGLEQGELASKEVVVGFNNWFVSKFVRLVEQDMVIENTIFCEWQEQVTSLNKQIGRYAEGRGLEMGTTLSVLLIYQEKYYICHVGDSRIYQIGQSVQQLTEDHTLVEHEVQMGLLTKEQAHTDFRRNILLQCVGASEVIKPQFDAGILTEDMTFLLCSDGFYHMIQEDEMCWKFQAELFQNKEQLTWICKEMTQLAIDRGECDNITVIGVILKDVCS